jgi:IgGFc binding protein/Secretion system C-terminal sorting domain
VSAIQFMEGLDCGGAGDPAMLILDDATQGVQSITFSTVESTVITHHSINIIINTDDVGEVSLDGALLSSTEFETVPSCPGFSYAQMNIDEGSHVLMAPSGLTGYAYGTGGYESYAYSLGSFRTVPGMLFEDVLCESDTDTLYIDLQGDFNDIFWVNSANPDDTLGYGAQFVLYPPVVSGVYMGTGFEFVSGCPHEELFSIEIGGQPIEVFASAEEGEICQFQSTAINTFVTPENPYYIYQWIPSNGLNNAEIGNPEASPFETTTYQLNVTSPGGCNVGTASVTIEVNEGSIYGMNIDPIQAVLCQGEEVQLNGEVEILSYNDFIAESMDMSKWEAILGGIASNVCGSGNQNAIYFNSGSETERSATTIPVDVSQGGTVHFMIKIANGAAPCEDADPGEDVFLQYSTDGIFYNLAVFNESEYNDLTELELEIPAAAFSANTRFRWIQPIFTDIDQDNWVLDEIYITTQSDEDLDIVWNPFDGLSSSNIPNPIAAPDVSTTYTLILSDVNSGCIYSEDVSIEVLQNPEIDVTPTIMTCDYTSVVLDASDLNGLDGLTYQWEPSSYVNTPNAQSTTLSEQGNTSATYTVIATNAALCFDTASVSVVVGFLESSISYDEVNFVLTADQAGASYQWINCDTESEVSGETDQSFSPFDLGINNTAWSVQITTDNCTGTSDCVTVIWTDVDEINSSGWFVFPNPTNGTLILFNSTHDPVLEVFITDVHGRAVERFKQTGTQVEIEINQAAGVYFLHARGAQSRTVKRIIKE